MPHRSPNTVVWLAVAAALSTSLIAASPAVSHLFELSDFSGTVPFSGGRLSIDPSHEEIYVISSNTVRVFNGSGMEIYQFAPLPDTGLVRDLAVEESGSILMLTHLMTPGEPPAISVTRCDYRGDALHPLVLSGLSGAYAEIVPDRMQLRDGELYLASRGQRLVAVVDAESGTFLRGYDLADLIELTEAQRDTVEISGFAVDPAGNLLLTLPTMFRAFVISADGTVASFGKPGSTPGSFSVVGGIAGDGRGHFFVSDRGRSVISVFDAQFRFVTEFGSQADGRDHLVRPDDLAVDPAGRLYVTQMGARGVSAYSMSFR